MGRAQVQPDGVSWTDRVKNPAPWFTWGADVRLRNDSSGNPFLTEADPPGHSYSFERLRLRQWNTLSPADWGELNVRFTWEGRHYWLPDSRKEWDESDLIFDSLNGKFKLPDFPATLIVGRQDFSFGDSWLISDGTPLDGPRTFYFDAVRATIELDRIKSTLDVIFLDQAGKSDARVPVLFGDSKYVIEQDERGVIAYLRNKSIEQTLMDAYFIYKHDKAVLPAGDTGEVYAFGSRLARNFNTNVAGRIEGVYEFGRRANTVMFPNQHVSLSAWGLNSRLTCSFRDRSKNLLWLGYEMRSGSDVHDPARHQFDPLWGRWAQFSELFPDELDRPSDRANLHRINLGYQIEPAAGLLLQAGYNAIFAYAGRKSGTLGYSEDGDFKGHLMTLLLRYDFNRYWSGLILGEYFIPGDYYAVPAGGGPLSSRDDPASFLRVQMLFTF